MVWGPPKLRELRLFEGEKISMVLTPHPLAFYGMHMLWIYVIVLSAIFFIVSDFIVDYMGPGDQGFALSLLGKSDSPLVAKAPIINVFASVLDSMLSGTISFSVRYGIVFIWFALLFTPSVGLSVMRVSWKWMAYVLFTGLVSIGVPLVSGLDEKMVYVFASLFGLLGMIAVDLYRRGHHYIVTNYRLITDVRFIYNIRDDISYDKINNLVMNQSLFGRLFDFGTLMPLTASGLGMGSDFAAVTVGAGKPLSSGVLVGGALTGGRSVNFPRDMSQFSLVGVRHPRQVVDLVSEYVHLDNESTYLKDISSDMREMLGEVKKKSKRKKS
ncbi:MAG: PH domain-containing protein [Candidatus Altiarchaeota archaeon]